MADPFRLVWQISIDNLVSHYEGAEDQLLNGLESRMSSAARQIEAYAKANHPWTNRTGAAEAGLVGKAEDGGRIVSLEHGVFYGIYLEFKHGGRWGILPAAVGTYGLPIINRELQQLAQEAVR